MLRDGVAGKARARFGNQLPVGFRIGRVSPTLCITESAQQIFLSQHRAPSINLDRRSPLKEDGERSGGWPARMEATIRARNSSARPRNEAAASARLAAHIQRDESLKPHGNERLPAFGLRFCKSKIGEDGNSEEVHLPGFTRGQKR